MSHVDDGRLHAWLDGELPGDRRRELEKHLEGCAACRQRHERAVAERRAASALLEGLEPGPVHAPDFAELEERAGIQGRPQRARPPWWGGAGLRWAASLALAFGVGWIVRSTTPWPVGEPQAASSDLRSDAAREAAPEQAPGGPAPAAPDLPAEGEVAAAPETPAPDADAPGRRAGAEQDLAAEPPVAGQAAAVDEVEALEKATAVSEPAAAPPLPGPATEPATGAGVPLGDAAAAAAEAERLRQERANRVAGGPPSAVGNAGARAGAPAGEAGAAMAREEAFADVAGYRPQPSLANEGFVAVDAAVAGAWLGVPPRRLPDHDVLLLEVGPAGSWAAATPGRPVLRTVYADAVGRPIMLWQQYRGSEGAADFPATVMAPDGTRGYRWLDDGYLLEIRAVGVAVDVLRALADRVE